MDAPHDPVPTPTTSAAVSPYPTVDASADRYAALSYSDLKPSPEAPTDFLWQGYLKPGAATLLTSLWKSGKSTLLAVLLARLKAGGALAGLPLRSGRAVVISEEAADIWCARGQNLALDGHVHWFCKPFEGRKPTEEQWMDLLDQVGRMHDRQGLDLVAIDSLANLSPMRSENDAVEMLKAVRPVERLLKRGVSVLITHHPKKGPVVPGQAARGSGALSAYVDVIVEMQAVCRRNEKDRRRRLRAFSRFAATPPSWVIEWTAEGTDYRGLGASAELDFAGGWPLLREVLEQATGPLTRRVILQRWPDTASIPAKVTLWKWLNRAVQEGQVLQEGLGSRKEPCLYSLPGMVEKWQANFLAEFNRRLERDAERTQPHRRESEVPEAMQAHR